MPDARGRRVGILTAGVKYNVIPGRAEIVIDCRTLPRTDEPSMRDELRRRIGEDLMARLEIELEQVGPSIEAPLDNPLYRLLEEVVVSRDPDGIPVPFMASFATDAKHLVRIGVPTYGFSPLRVGPNDGLLGLMHGDDERVSVEALAFGLPALWEAVTLYCASQLEQIPRMRAGWPPMQRALRLYSCMRCRHTIGPLFRHGVVGRDYVGPLPRGEQ